MYLKRDTIPASLGVGVQVRNVTYRVDGTAWAAECDTAIADAVEIDAAEFEALTAANAAWNEANPLPVPEVVLTDAQAFKLDAYTYLGGEAFVMPLAGYIAPALDALNARNWALARTIVGAARQANALTAAQYTHLLDLMVTHGIPEA